LRITASLFFVIWLTGCGGSEEGGNIPFGPGLADFSTKIAGEYYIHRTSAHQIMIALRAPGDDIPVIPAKVVQCDFDWDFIIARQQELRRRYPNNPEKRLYGTRARQVSLLDNRREDGQGLRTVNVGAVYSAT